MTLARQLVGVKLYLDVGTLHTWAPELNFGSFRAPGNG